MTARTILLASCADHGTSSITASYERALRPDLTVRLSKGLKKMAPAAIVRTLRQVKQWKAEKALVICLFNAPILLAGMARGGRDLDWRGILDWTETHPSGRRGPLFDVYNRLYLRAFRNLGRVLSPAPGFRDYYRALGGDVEPTLYPLPCDVGDVAPLGVLSRPRVLFIGADLQRKGGDLILDYWARERPEADLTFVCPRPPEVDIAGVSFRRDVRPGTAEHDELFRAHDVLVLPTRMEPFGYVVLEGLCRGLAVVTTSMAGAATLVLESGGVVEATPPRCVESLDLLLREPTRIRHIRATCQSFLPGLAARTKASLDDLASRNHPSGPSLP